MLIIANPELPFSPKVEANFRSGREEPTILSQKTCVEAEIAVTGGTGLDGWDFSFSCIGGGFPLVTGPLEWDSTVFCRTKKSNKWNEIQGKIEVF